MFTQNPQTVGIEELTGTYVFDLRTCNRTLAFNRFFWNMIRPKYRQAFLDDEEAAMTVASLSTRRRHSCARDWLGIVQYGVNFFVLEKWARVVRRTNLEVYAIMRGETLEEFMQTRAVPHAT